MAETPSADIAPSVKSRFELPRPINGRGEARAIYLVGRLALDGTDRAKNPGVLARIGYREATCISCPLPIRLFVEIVSIDTTVAINAIIPVQMILRRMVWVIDGST